MAAKRVRILTAAAICLVFVAALLTACSQSTPTTWPTEEYKIEVHTSLREFYNLLGGEDVLGAAISPIQPNNCQYTANARLCLDPLARGSARFFLFPLGHQLPLDDEQVGSDVIPADPSAVTIDGIAIYPDFLPLYNQLQGALYVGRPLTAPRINYDAGRIEQYFENIGFFRNLNDLAGEPQLLAYGAYVCDQDCRTQNDPARSAIILSGGSEVEQPFLVSLQRMGGLEFFGQPLTRPYRNPDGSIEQVYEKAVFYTEDDGISRPALRSMPAMVGIHTSPPITRTEKRGYIFYPVENDLGYLVVQKFDEFIAAHGGYEVSGKPINAVWLVENDLYRQCFENYCLDYNHAAPEALKVSLTSLGAVYLQASQIDTTLIVRNIFSPDTVLLQVSEEKPRLTSAETQLLVIQVLRRFDNEPIPNVEGIFTLRLPDGREFSGRFPPTDINGMKLVRIKPLDLPTGSVVNYEVCLNVPSEKRICAAESYLIWD